MLGRLPPGCHVVQVVQSILSESSGGLVFVPNEINEPFSDRMSPRFADGGGEARMK